jgi:acyl carrier protein
MTPTKLVILDKFPLTPTGKLDRRALPMPKAPEIASPEGPRVSRTPTEEMLVRLWCDILARTEIGIDQNFFDLGGDSLQAIRVISRVRDRLRAPITLEDIFANPTIAELAARIDHTRAAGQVTAAPLRIAVSRCRQSA